jgi:hypothetical protein
MPGFSGTGKKGDQRIFLGKGKNPPHCKFIHAQLPNILEGDLGPPQLKECTLLVLGKGFSGLFLDHMHAGTVLTKSNQWFLS